MKLFINPMALMIANAGVFAALTMASAEVAYQATESATQRAATDTELAQARRIIDSMERHGVRDSALMDLKNDLRAQLAVKAPQHHLSANEFSRFRTADGRWRSEPIAAPTTWNMQPTNERKDFTPGLSEKLFEGQNKPAI